MSEKDNLQDADGKNEVITTTTDLTPNQEEVYVRIENVLYTDCFDTTSFNIIVNPDNLLPV